MIKTTDIERIIGICNGRINRCDDIVYEAKSTADVEEKKLFLAIKCCYHEILDQLEYLLRRERRERWQKGHPKPSAEETVEEAAL